MALKIWTNEELRQSYKAGIKEGKGLAHDEELRFLRRIYKLAFFKMAEEIKEKIEVLEKE